MASVIRYLRDHEPVGSVRTRRQRATDQGQSLTHASQPEAVALRRTGVANHEPYAVAGPEPGVVRRAGLEPGAVHWAGLEPGVVHWAVGELDVDRSPRGVLR